MKLSDGVSAEPPSFAFYDAATGATLSGDAVVRNVNASVSVVGQIGYGSSITFTNLDAGNGGGKLVAIDYINADYTFSGDVDCPNCRYAYASVNGGEAVRFQLPISGQVCVGVSWLRITLKILLQSWDLLFTGYQLWLDGFIPGNENSIELSNPDAWAPDVYRLGIQA